MFRTCQNLRVVGATARGMNMAHKANVHIEARIIQLGYTLPALPPAPKGNYMNYSREGNIIYLSGHLPQKLDGTLIKGRLGENMTVEEGQVAARTAALQLLASMKAAVGDLDKVQRVLRVSGFVNSTPDFTSQPMVLNGCSDFFGEVFGVEVARHARSALGVNVLPLGVAVEIEAIIKVSD
jgi:enamine deaminase RidA (YjgF/YER057c/UK114 family)